MSNRVFDSLQVQDQDLFLQFNSFIKCLGTPTCHSSIFTKRDNFCTFCLQMLSIKTIPAFQKEVEMKLAEILSRAQLFKALLASQAP